jgi:HEAT repeat protein
MKMLPLLLASMIFLAGSAGGQDSQPADRGRARAAVRVVDEDGRPVEGVTVRARLPFAVPYSDLALQDFDARSGPEGVALVEGLLPDEPIVFEIEDDRFVPTRTGVVLPQAERGTSEPPVATDVVLTKGRSAEIQVEDAFGAPLDGAEVRLLPLVEPRLRRGQPFAADAARGSVRIARAEGLGPGKVAIDQLPAELLTCEVRAPGFETRMIVIDLRAEKGFTGAVRLDRDPQPPLPVVSWMESVPDAFATARAGGLPVMVAMAMDGERANDWIAGHHFRDLEVARLSEHLPCLLSSAFGAGGLQAEGVDHGEVDDACARYGSTPCAAHRAVETWARAEVVGDLPFEVPRHVFFAPDGREIEHRAFYLSERDLRRMMLRALRACDNDSATWLALRRLKPLWHALTGPEDSAARRAALGALVELVSSGDEYAVLLLRELGLEHVAAPVRLQILDSLLLPALRDPLSALKAFIHDPEPAVRRRVWQRLRAVTARIDVATAVAWIEDERDDAVMEAALHALRVDDTGAAVVVADAQTGERWRLVEMLVDRIEASAIRGLDAVLDSGPAEGKNRLLRALAAHPEDESAMRRLLAHASAPAVGAVAAIRALTGVPDGPGERGMKVLLDQARSGCALVRQEAIAALGALDGSRHAADLVSALEDASEPVRIEAALALWRRGDRRGGPVLADAISDPEAGAAAHDALASRFVDSIPRDRDAWLRWLSGEPVVPGGN